MIKMFLPLVSIGVGCLMLIHQSSLGPGPFTLVRGTIDALGLVASVGGLIYFFATALKPQKTHPDFRR